MTEYSLLQVEEESHLQKCDLITGGILAFNSAFMFTIINTIFKKFQLDQTDTIFIQSLIKVGLTTLWIMFKRHQFWFGLTKLQFLVAFQGLTDSMVLICIYQSLVYISLGDAMTLMFSSPIFTSTFYEVNSQNYH